MGSELTLINRLTLTKERILERLPMNGTPPTPGAEIVSTAGGVGGADELWCSKALDLLWMPPRARNVANPGLFQLASPEAVRHLAAPKTLHRTEGSWVWYWRADPTFGAWVVRATRRAGAAHAAVVNSMQPALYHLREHFESRVPGSWQDVESVAATAAALPVPDIPADSYFAAMYGFEHRWGEAGEESGSHRAYGQPFLWKTPPTGWFKWYAEYRLSLERETLAELSKRKGSAPAVEAARPRATTPRRAAATGPSLF